MQSPLASVHPHHTLRSLEITGGFLKGLKLDLADGVNCIIGGRGSGKTTLLELVRFVLGAPSPIGKDTDALVKKNLGAGCVRVHVETKHGVRFVVERRVGAASQVFTPEGVPVAASLDGVFMVDAYGQNEIESVAADRASQLALIDRFAEPAMRPIQKLMTDVQGALRDAATELVALEDEIADLEDKVAEARAIEEQLRPLEAGTGGEAERVRAAHAAKGLRKAEVRSVHAAKDVLEKMRVQLRAVETASRNDCVGVVPKDVAEGPNADAMAAIRLTLTCAVDSVDEAVTRVAVHCEAALQLLGEHARALAARHAEQDAAYDTLVLRQNEEESRVTERARLQRRHAELAPARARLEAKRARHRAGMESRAGLLQSLHTLREQRFHVRAEIARHLTEKLDGAVRVSVSQSETLDGYRAILSEALSDLSGHRPKSLVDKLAPTLMPADLARIVRSRDGAALAERAGFERSPERAHQVIDALSVPQRLYALEAAPLDDIVRIEFLHGKVWKDSTEASPGQRSGAILPILLLQAERPLLVDQPEDNVDPDFMCNVILAQVERLKGTRQFLFVSHHANVPVLPSAERIVELASDGPQGRVETHGTVETMREPILRWLEGGREAFERRRARYT